MDNAKKFGAVIKKWVKAKLKNPWKNGFKIELSDQLIELSKKRDAQLKEKITQLSKKNKMYSFVVKDILNNYDDDLGVHLRNIIYSAYEDKVSVDFWLKFYCEFKHEIFGLFSRDGRFSEGEYTEHQIRLLFKNIPSNVIDFEVSLSGFAYRHVASELHYILIERVGNGND